MKTMPSIETQRRMHTFFMETSAPRIYAKMLEEELSGGKSVEQQIEEIKLKNKRRP